MTRESGGEDGQTRERVNTDTRNRFELNHYPALRKTVVHVRVEFDGYLDFDHVLGFVNALHSKARAGLGPWPKDDPS